MWKSAPIAGICTLAPVKTGIIWCNTPGQRDAGTGKPCPYPRLRRIIPIQNIGAYGIELKHVCEYVDCIELATGAAQRLTAEQCRFGYRDSIFKHEYQDRYVIVAVGLRLAKTGSRC